MNLETILREYCVGCSGGHEKRQVQTTDGLRYYHPEGSVGHDGKTLNFAIVCTATMHFLAAAREANGDMHQSFLQDLGKL